MSELALATCRSFIAHAERFVRHHLQRLAVAFPTNEFPHLREASTCPVDFLNEDFEFGVRALARGLLGSVEGRSSRLTSALPYTEGMPEFDSPFHRLHVTDNGAWRLLKFERNHQSSMALDDPFETDIEYVNYLHLPLAVKPNAQSALVIGLGGGSLVKRMWRDYPMLEIDAVEIDEQVVAVAREYFALPDDERIRVFIDDGRAFLGYCAETYDLIVVDAFDDDHIPRPLLTEEFLRTCRDHLSADGAIAYNVIGAVTGSYSKPFRSLHRTVSNVWRNVWVFPIGSAGGATDSTRNMIMLASDADLSADELLERIATRVGGLVTVTGFERFGEDLYRGSIRSGDVPIITSPRPHSRKGNRRR